jgi:hypothetical protein
VGHAPKIIAVFVLLTALGGLVAYFLSEPDDHSTEKLAARFANAAKRGVALDAAVKASPEFKSVTFGACGHLDASPDSGPQGSLIFSPITGAFTRFTSFDEFTSRNPKLLSEHQECRHVGVLYMTQFPFRGQINLELDGRGVILKASGPFFFN